ncbi:hypothetical protein [Desulfosoma sp.]|uniref:hypothetical protein n=1 Tax=Desulfosoma sp. TaxID=2603217 RepID=UPI004048F58B
MICVAVTTAVHADDQSFNTAADHLVQLQVLQTLNQIVVSLTHILTYNDKVVLDQEYNTIINNLNLSKIPDADIISLLQELMDLLTSSKIQEHERAYLSRTYEKNVQEELRRRLRKRVFETDLLLNPYMGVLSAIVNVGSFYFNYRDRMDDYKKEREEAAWKIEAATLQGLNNFYKNLLKYSWNLIRRYQLPDEWRLNEKQLTDYTAILKEPDIDRRYRKLERLEASFQQFPPYWYYRGQAAYEMGNHREALRCFVEFQNIHQGILRKDPFAASTAMHKIMLTVQDASATQIRRDLEVVLANSNDEDWGNILFAALQYARLGDHDMAGRLIMRNLDNGYMAFIEDPEMLRALGPALLLHARSDVFDRILDTLLKNNQVKNYDVLWLYGQLRNRDILRRIQSEFDHVLLLAENKSWLNPLNVFRGDNLTLLLPTRWMADNVIVQLRVVDEDGEHKVEPSDVAPLTHHPQVTVLTFKDALSTKKFLKKKRQAQIIVSLAREKLAEDRSAREAYTIAMIFSVTVISAHEQLEKINKYTSYLVTNSSLGEDKTLEFLAKESGKRKETKKAKANGEDGQVLWFTKERLVLNGESFPWSDEGIRF